jgi:hypothetical protein
MKKLLLTTLLFIPLSIFAQDISLEQVISLKSKNLKDVKAYLTSKNWKMTDEIKHSRDFLGSIDFVLNKNKSNDTPVLEISYLYKNLSTEKIRISFKIYNDTVFNNYLTQLNSLGFKLQKNEEDNDQEKIYQLNGTTIKLSTKTEYSEYYYLLILATSDYKEY